MRHLRIALLCAVITLMLVAVAAQPGFAQQSLVQKGTVKPTPHWPDGRPNFGPEPGQAGVWQSRGERLADLDTPDAENRRDVISRQDRFPGKPKVSEVPFQPWARALYDFRQENQFEPYTRCKPSGGPRQILTPYGTEFIDMPDLKRFYITNTGGPHSFRLIFMDGRAHPKDQDPSYFGHSVGKWEGDTLSVDTTGFNERFWMDREGSPHTEKLHLIEKFTRTDFSTMKYEVTIDDPGAYTATWKSGFYLRFFPGQESFEYMCQDNNHNPELTPGHESRIVP